MGWDKVADRVDPDKPQFHMKAFNISSKHL